MQARMWNEHSDDWENEHLVHEWSRWSNSEGPEHCNVCAAGGECEYITGVKVSDIIEKVPHGKQLQKEILRSLDDSQSTAVKEAPEMMDCAVEAGTAPQSLDSATEIRIAALIERRPQDVCVDIPMDLSQFGSGTPVDLREFAAASLTPAGTICPDSFRECLDDLTECLQGMVGARSVSFIEHQLSGAQSAREGRHRVTHRINSPVVKSRQPRALPGHTGAAKSAVDMEASSRLHGRMADYNCKGPRAASHADLVSRLRSKVSTTRSGMSDVCPS